MGMFRSVAAEADAGFHAFPGRHEGLPGNGSVMTPAEQLGAELVMLIRREDELMRQLEGTRRQIDAIIKEYSDWPTQVIGRGE